MVNLSERTVGSR